MQTRTETTPLEEFGWTFRSRPVAEEANRVLLLLHGWTGNENSMWAFTRNISSSYAILSPRAPYPAENERGGYSWRKIKPGTWGSPTLEELRVAANNIVSLVDNWQASVKIASPTFDIVGFSQGAALATTIAALHPSRVEKVAVLSGFIPPGVDSVLRPNLFDNTLFFWAHGKQDELIPIERGRSSIKLLEDSGADVHFCEADIGHKVSKECRRALDTFLAK